MQVDPNAHPAIKNQGNSPRHHDEKANSGERGVQELPAALRKQYMRPVRFRRGVHGNDEAERAVEDQHEGANGARETRAERGSTPKTTRTGAGHRAQQRVRQLRKSSDVVTVLGVSQEF